MRLTLFLLFCVILALGQARRRKRPAGKVTAPREILYGQNVVVRCMSRRRRAKVKGFYKEGADGKKVKIRADDFKFVIIRRRGDRESILLVKNFEKEDVGKYICKVGKAFLDVDLSPKGKAPEEPPAAFMARSYYTQAGKKVTLYCIVTGKFDGFFYESWGSLSSVTRVPRLFKVSDLGKQLFGTVHKLTINKVENRKSKQYFCRSGNFLASTTVYSYSNAGNSVYFKDSEVNTYANNYAEVTCKGKKGGSAEIFKVNANNSLTKIPTESFLGQTSAYRKASVEHAGYYLCKAGEDTAVMKYNFLVKKPRSDKSPITRVGRNAILNYNIPVENERIIGSGSFLRWDRVDSSSTFSAKVTKTLASMFGRFRGTAGARFEWTEKGAGLIIHNVTSADSGFYSLRHDNDAFSRAVLQLDIKE